MISPNDIFKKVMGLFFFSEQDRNAIMPSCILAAVRYTARLKKGADEKDENVLSAAAANAVVHFLYAKSIEEGPVETFKAGDISVSYDCKRLIELAKEIEKTAILDATPLLDDKHFCFKAV